MASVATTWGSTEEERTAVYPCDGHLAGADLALYRAVNIEATPAVVFRWLCQLKVAPYSYDWIDNGGRTSPRTLTPGAETLARGQRVMSIFELVDFADGEHITMVLCRRARVFGQIAVSYVVGSRPGGGSRLVVKLRVGQGRGILARVRETLLAWGDLVMMRKQLLTLKRLAEARG